jgi:dUTP pyrophosphatase
MTNHAKAAIVKIQKLHPEAKLPKRWSSGAVGYDLHALLLSETGRGLKVALPPNFTTNIPTGISVECPDGYFLFVCPRSGLAKHSLTVTNSPGLIDPDYRGEIRVMLYNGGHQTFYIEHEMRIAQLVILPITPVSFTEVKSLSTTERGVAGFGSTGV